MRVLFTCMAYTGHLHPLVPVARALAEAGHEVAFATHPVLAPLVERAGFQHLPAGLHAGSPEVVSIHAEANRLSRFARMEIIAGQDFAGVRAAHMADDVMALHQTWPADLLVREELELGGCLAAERLGLPHATVAITAAGHLPGVLDLIAEPLDVLRAARGLPPDPDLAMLSRYLTLHPFPPSFGQREPLPTDHAISPFLFDRSGDEVLPAGLDDLPGRPTVYATLGTYVNGRVDVFETILAGLRDEPLNLIVTVGRDGDPARFGPQPPHVRVERYIPQSLLFPRCDLVLTHAGSGTVMGALAHGLPLVVVPVGADQPENAARCVALGLGRALDPNDLTPTRVRDAVRAVLYNPAYRGNVERMQQEIRALPGPEYAVALLERLAVERQPMTATRARECELVSSPS
jgi:UDP:flavonoid glycosyltransferase YjiC (YdhE family)